ncbi:hypothetical protein IX317_002140 [Fusobacterium sp. DD29]|uniref:DUF6275 family protein n=1 Tax=unclassified Fusobacterium TaxID=2648384 RepID=UPI001B8AC4FD|nr:MULTISPECIES: DUF6275 family protein [unclassified Fusobacterium]MBR8750418.1 hypothetical protein [Fusobacterium sp. DD29]MBR8762659.1 hypothetical protein [Fusobacterium sp. DD25]MBR8768684.1 hypothetical protein [Fusobacterium sp. DD43]MBR8772757.1 hypothetical protein [Fusobacterium sp. DD40]MBR8776966.1 hypothetical protein [Fusobacterium sp. DD17]
MNYEDFLELAKEKVYEYERNNGNTIRRRDVYIVWSCKTLQNGKALLSANNNEKRAFYYEFTLNGDRGEFYMDVYDKKENICLDSYGCAKEERIK